jgi:hypothetical protein
MLPFPKQVGQVSFVLTSMAGRTRWRVICINPNLLRGRMLCFALSFCMFWHIRSYSFCRFSARFISMKSTTIIPPIGIYQGRQLHEDEYAYDIILRLARELLSRGAKVHIIIQDKKDGIRDGHVLANSKRETCMGDPIPLNQVARLKQRCDWVNKLYRKDKSSYKRAVFIHVDSRSKGQQTDVFFITPFSFT